jgi:hypothetical protein
MIGEFKLLNSTYHWSLSKLEFLLGPSIDHGGRIIYAQDLTSGHRTQLPGPFTFVCGCLAVGLTPNLAFRSCSSAHADLVSAA